MNKKQIIKNVFSNWAGFLINIVIAFFMSPIIVHKLGNVYYGLWVIMMQLSGYLGILELGVRSSVVKYVAEYVARKDFKALNRLISLTITIYSSISILSLLVALVIAFFFTKIFNFPDYSLNTAKLVTVIIGINVSLGFLFNVFYGILMGIQRYDIYNKVLIISTVLKNCVILSFLYFGYGIIALGVIQAIFALISNLIVVFLCKKQMPQLKIKFFYFNSEQFKKVFNYSIISFFITVSQKISFQTDLIVIGIFLNATQVTYYAIPATLVEYMRRLVGSMSETFVPLTSELEGKNDRKNIKSLLRNGTKLSLIIALPFCIVFYFNGKEFIQLWMGDEYARNGAIVLKILAVTHLLSISHLTSREILFGLALHRFNAICYGCEAVINLVLSVILVKSYGILGVVIGTAIPHIFLVVFIFPVMITRVLKINLGQYFLKTMLPPVISSLFFSVYCIFLANYYKIESLVEYFLVITLGLPIYIICVYLICLTRDQKNWIKEFFTKKYYSIIK